MIFDDVERIIRYVELNTNGEPFHECLSARIGGADEEERWSALVEESAHHGQSIVRLCNHEARCCNPVLTEIESDGRGSIQAKADYPDALDSIEFWDATTMERKFVTVTDTHDNTRRVVRLERNEWTEELLTHDLEIYEDDNGVAKLRVTDG